MKKKFFLLVFVCCLFMIGCGKKDNKDTIKDLSKKINNLSSYNLKGNLEILNGEDMYMYDVEVSFKKDNQFKVSLTNTNNNHVQILLKNVDGVYVLTPSLNKSFKFQSDWPYNNSQIYLYQTIIKDIENDKDNTVEKKDKDIIIKSKVNYSNNPELVAQNVYINEDKNIYKVEVINKEGNVQMSMEFSSIDLKPTYDDDYFSLDKCLETSKADDVIKETSSIDSIIYPLYLPSNTFLSSQNTVETNIGERVILTFDGDNPFMLFQETAAKNKDFVTIPVHGEPAHVADSLGVLSNNSISWYSNGIEYYVTSDKLNETELVNIANSINVLPVGK